MGAGKSTFLEKFSGSGFELIDLDERILQTTSYSRLGDFIDGIGWETFREIEFKNLSEILKKNVNMVVALGGGAFTDRFQSLLRQSKDNSTIWLNTSLEVCLKRIFTSSNRPLAKKGEEYLRSLYLEREEDYKKCDIFLNQKEQESVRSIKDLISLIPSK
jgi:shikimate kinase